MTVPEWVMITLVGGLLSILGWATTRMVGTNDVTAQALSDIREHLATINGRLGKTELWQMLHGEDDCRRFNEALEELKEMRRAMDKR